MRYLPLLLVCLTLAFPAFAHETTEPDPDHPQAHTIPAAVEHNIVSITEEGGYRVIHSNGIPNHATGQFPNRGNPNSISEQDHNYRVPLNPQKTGRVTQHNGVVGVALNGIPFEPGTAECYGRARGQRGPMESCTWREEAIVGGQGKLGLDSSNAHVQPDGSYHYHGVPNGLLAVLPAGDLVQVGYAADGFKLMVSRSGAYKPGYTLKSGTRPSGEGSPGGRYDGTYTADYEFTGAGNLDECNGASVNGEYVYFITTGFPFAPRCLMGQVNESFARRGPPSMGGRGQPPFGRSGPSSGREDPMRRPPPPF